MPQNIHVFETRDVNYLKPYLDKATSLGFKITLSDNSSVENNKRFKEFISLYTHHSVNPPEFEIACFARYFAIADLVKNDEPFLLTDTDVYITKAFRDLQGFDFKDTFVGSEGFDKNGSQVQISPHCTFWNRTLLNNFIEFVISTYKKDRENDLLESYYRSLTERFTHTGISDMNLIYMWIHGNQVPYLNSNSANFRFGIDHNLSALMCEDGEFKSFAGRKFLKVRDDKITCFLKSGKELDMALLHFQGSYKAILERFYLSRNAKFIYFSLRNNYRQTKKIFKN